MLVRFDSRVGGFTMFDEVAVQLLKMMGHSGTVPSAILADDIPRALERLQAALAAAPEPPPSAADAREGRSDDEEPRVSLRQRAHPLIDLLARAAQADGFMPPALVMTFSPGWALRQGTRRSSTSRKSVA